MVDEAQFNQAADWISSLPKDGPVQASNDEKLTAYGLFKQVKEGDCNTSRPGMLSGFEAGYKWDAWNKNKGTSKADAMKGYVDHIDSLKNKYGNSA